MIITRDAYELILGIPNISAAIVSASPKVISYYIDDEGDFTFINLMMNFHFINIYTRYRLILYMYATIPVLIRQHFMPRQFQSSLPS